MKRGSKNIRFEHSRSAAGALTWLYHRRFSDGKRHDWLTYNAAMCFDALISINSVLVLRYTHQTVVHRVCPSYHSIALGVL